MKKSILKEASSHRRQENDNLRKDCILVWKIYSMSVYHCKSRETRGWFCAKITICYWNLRKNWNTSKTIDLCSAAFTLLRRRLFFLEKILNFSFKIMEKEGLCSLIHLCRQVSILKFPFCPANSAEFLQPGMCFKTVKELGKAHEVHGNQE